MKRLLFALMALALAAPSLAFNPVSGTSSRVKAIRAYQTATKPYAQRVAVVYDGYDKALNVASVKALAVSRAKLLGPVFDSWRKRGVEVHFYSTDFFEIPADSLADGTHNQRVCALWQSLGDQYPTVVCVGFSGDTTYGKAARKRYFCPDSTTAKIVHIGGGSAATLWSQNTQTFGICDTATTTAYFDQRKACVTSYTNTNADSLWFAGGAYGIRSGRLLPGVASVVRLFHPVALADYFGWGADSAFGVQPTAGDSTADPLEIMPVAWRVYWTSGGSVDFIKYYTSTADYDFNFGPILETIVSRTTLIPPALAAMEFDDVFDSNPTTATRPSNAAYDSVFREFHYTWLVPLTISTSPRHAAEYYAGDDPTREAAWEHDAGWTWIRRGIPWVHHSHDSTSSDIGSGLVGRFGGYSTHNGSTSAGWTTDSITAFGITRFRYSHRGAGVDVRGDKYTILYRLQWSDSLRRATCPECFTPPYLSFPNNEMLPTDWRARPASVAAAVTANYWTRWKDNQGDGNCTIDSTLWAFHYGLGIPSGGELFVRTVLANVGTGTEDDFLSHRPVGLAVASVAGNNAQKNWTVSGENDSVVARTPFTYPGERMSFRLGAAAGSRHIRVRNVGMTYYDAGSRTNYTFNVQPTLAGLMGSRTGNTTSAGFSTWSESWSADPGGAYTVSVDQKNFGTENVRVVYLHPSANNTENSGWSFATGPKTSYPIQCARLGLLGGLRTLESVAGHKLIRWVYPWQVYAQ